MSRALVLLSLAAALVPSRAAAEEVEEAPADRGLPGHARLLVSLCEAPPFAPAELFAVLGVELLGEGVSLGGQGDAAPPAGEPVALLLVDLPRCGAGERRVEIAVEHSVSRRRAERTVLLESAEAEVRSRVLALAIAELLRGSWSGLGPGPEAASGPSAEAPEASDPAPVEVAAEPVAEPLPPPRPELGEPPTWLLDAAADARTFPSHRGALAGGRVEVSYGPRSVPLRVALDAGGWYGGADDPLGEVDLVSASGALSLLVTTWTSWASAAIGPRVEVGWARATGRPYDETTWGGTVDALLVVVAVRADLRVALGRGLSLLVEPRVGYVVSSLDARADERRAAGMGGAELALSLGLSYAP